MNEEYNNFAKAFSEIVDLEKVLVSKKMGNNRLKQRIKNGDTEGEFGLNITAHAYNQISVRLSEIAKVSEQAHSDLIETPVSESILEPDRLKAFIYTMLNKARQDRSYKVKKSKSGSEELVYTVNMSKWSTDEKELFLVFIVENSTVKTGYFNWVNRS